MPVEANTTDCRGVALDNVVALLSRTQDLTRASGAPWERSFDEVLADVGALGLAEGTPVIIALSNGAHLLHHYFAVLLSGLVPLTVSPATSSARITQLAENLHAGALIAARINPESYGTANIFRVGAEEAILLPMGGPQGAYESGQVLMLTSGTSGMFSACLHAGDSLLRNARRHAGAVGLTSQDRILISLPMYYSYAIVAQALAALTTGASLVITGPPFNPQAYRKVIEEQRITSSSITPTIARQLIDKGEKLPGSLRSLSVGGDQLKPEHVAGLLEIHRGRELYLTYGLTEAGPRVATLAAHREPASRFASVGTPLEEVEIELRNVDAQGTGELIIRTDTALLRKVGPSARQPLLAPGVVASGDLFRQDEDGYLFYEGRLSDFVIIRGEKVSLYSIRHVVQSVPGVARCIPHVRENADGEKCIDLEIHAPDPEKLSAEQVRRTTYPLLMRSERPRNISIHPLDTAAQHK